jgi:hypothetical protein
LHSHHDRPNLAYDELKTNDFIRWFHPPDNQDFTLANLWLFGYLKIMLEGSSFETAEDLQGQMMEILMLILVFPFGAVFEEWKIRLLRCLEECYSDRRRMNILISRNTCHSHVWRPSRIKECYFADSRHK